MKVLGLAKWFDVDGAEPRLIGSRCRQCGATACPPQSYHCLEPTARVSLGPRATVEVHTTIRVAPDGFRTPYVVGYLRLEDGPRITARLGQEPTVATRRESWIPTLETIAEGDRAGYGLVYVPPRSSG